MDKAYKEKTKENNNSPKFEVEASVEQECPASCSSEPGGDELVSVGERRAALAAREHSRSSGVLAIHSAHDGSTISN